MFYAKDPLRFFPLTYLVNALKYAFSLSDALQCARALEGGAGLIAPLLQAPDWRTYHHASPREFLKMPLNK